MLKPLCYSLAILLTPASVFAQTMVIKTTDELITTDSPTLFAYNKESKQLEVINLLTSKSHELTLPKNAFGFDVATIANTTDKQALVLTESGVYKSTAGEAELLFNYSSVISQLKVDKFEKINFVFDANNDGLSDILIPDLTSSTLYIQNNEGAFKPNRFEQAAEYNGRFSEKGLTLEVNINNQPVIIDFNKDGVSDLVFASDFGANVLLANAQGYADALTPINFNIELGELSNGETRKIKQLLDVNNDGLLDFTTRQFKPTQGMDSLDIKIAHTLYLGNEGGFSATPINLFETQGPSELLLKTDFNNDGLIDLQKMDLDIGLGTIASMAMGGGSTDVDVEMNLYKQQSDGSFASKSGIELDLEMEVGMNGGESSPALYLGDINGDSQIDAVYKYSKKTLHIYYGEQDSLLNKKRKKLKLTLPKYNKDILLVDINQDGKKDFVFKFTEKDGTSKIKTQLN
ncbi:FG-GAP repeat domain-containing protein [Pseudoalteromonas carrageenovora]|uniref:FG-GAP repeat domain-containing protein n=1 Tax=Pseudoalteromonas carrageenovora TaxID=227 RepID=UPI0026E1174A|nr:VCBS repeat-containing protein [Pseudoalteromonas carrageenovora]MDO6464008.1 VCBS repeat-containing protein [Pseudoalteromonas carrageenovora]MDO6547433.1 VCBS repeat-containing protein [Pseudoalteromonas carrageenovora]MDO6832007.1 VCBS repeat-containing protein [Pseudoalteromonas carrageenovora]